MALTDHPNDKEKVISMASRSTIPPIQTGIQPNAIPPQDQQPQQEVTVVQKIGKEEIAEASQILQKYKEGKANLEQRIIDNEQWY